MTKKQFFFVCVNFLREKKNNKSSVYVGLKFFLLMFDFIEWIGRMCCQKQNPACNENLPSVAMFVYIILKRTDQQGAFVLHDPPNIIPVPYPKNLTVLKHYNVSSLLYLGEQPCCLSSCHDRLDGNCAPTKDFSVASLKKPSKRVYPTQLSSLYL